MKKVVAVTINEDGSIKSLLFRGNKRPTPICIVIKMLENDHLFDWSETDLEVVERNGKKYVRKKPNDTVVDNLSNLPEVEDHSLFTRFCNWFFKFF